VVKNNLITDVISVKLNTSGVTIVLLVLIVLMLLLLVKVGGCQFKLVLGARIMMNP